MSLSELRIRRAEIKRARKSLLRLLLTLNSAS